MVSGGVSCYQPLYQKAKLGCFGTSLDLTEWGCPRCKNTIHTDGGLSVDVPTSQVVTNPSPPHAPSLAPRRAY